jgi:streptogramin lyase
MAVNGQSFQFIEAAVANRTVSTCRAAARKVDQQLVLDTVDNFNGLERLIVIAVDLDSPIELGAAAKTRSQLYRAITRSQMMVVVVNEVLRGGWLEFLTCVKYNEEASFNTAHELKQNVKGSASKLLKQQQQHEQWQKQQQEEEEGGGEEDEEEDEDDEDEEDDEEDKEDDEDEGKEDEKDKDEVEDDEDDKDDADDEDDEGNQKEQGQKEPKQKLTKAEEGDQQQGKLVKDWLEEVEQADFGERVESTVWDTSTNETAGIGGRSFEEIKRDGFMPLAPPQLRPNSVLATPPAQAKNSNSIEKTKVEDELPAEEWPAAVEVTVYPERVSTVAGVVGKVAKFNYPFNFVGSVAGSKGHADGEGSAAKFNYPMGICACEDGSVLVADCDNHCIRRIAADGTVSTVAGVAGSKGHVDGEGSAVNFNYPEGVCACADGSVWVADRDNHCIRRIAADGTVSSVSTMAADGERSAAKLNGVCLCTDRSVWVADMGNHCIHRIAADGTVSTVAGVAGSKGHVDGEGSAAKFSGPKGVCACADGSVWVADQGNHCIRRIAADGTVSTVAGVVGSKGHVDGEGSVAKFNYPKGVCACADGSVWVTDSDNHCIRRIAYPGLTGTMRA